MIRSLVRIALVLATLLLAAVALIRQPVFAWDAKEVRLADPKRLEDHVRFLTSQPRNADHPEELDRVASYIANELRESGAKVEEQVFTARRKTYRNVIATFGAEGPLLVIGAHYDAFGDLPGADDNASGTAGLLELARILGKTRPRQNVALVAFTTEEPPFFASEQMGSAVHAKRLEGRAVAGMICLEMIGYFHGNQHWDSWVLGLLYPDKGDFVSVAGGWSDRPLLRQVKKGLREAGVRTLSFTGPRQLLDGSDQRNYWARGWPAVMISDTAYLRNPHYHTAGDTSDTLDYDAMARIVDGVHRAVR